MLDHVTLCGLVWECGRRLWIREYTEQGFRIFLFNPLWVMPSPVGRCLFLSV